MRNVFAILLVAWSTVSASELNVSWTPPTHNTDGTPILATGETALTYFRVEWGTCSGTAFGVGQGELIVGASFLTAKLNLATGTHCVRVYAASGLGWSDPSNHVVAVVSDTPGAIPQPPSGITLAVQVVFQFVGARDRVNLIPVGTVPAGTPYDIIQVLNGHCVVPRAAVTWYGSVKPQVVFAKCL